MNRETTMILETWDTVKDYVPAAKRLDIAIQWFRSFEEFGIDPGDFKDVIGEDKILEEAFNTLYGGEEEPSYDDDGQEDLFDLE